MGFSTNKLLTCCPRTVLRELRIPISQNPRRVAHCRVSSLFMVCRKIFAAKANLLAIETALLTRRQQSADHKNKVCQVGVTVNTE